MTDGQKEPEELSPRERLERLKLQTEIARNEEEKKKIELERNELERKSGLHWLRKPLFIQALIASIIIVPVIWFYIHDIALPLSSRENIKLSKELMKRNKELNEERKKLDEMILQHAALQNQKIQLEAETETLKLEKDILVKQRKELEEEVKSMSSFTNWYDKGVGEYAHQRYKEAISSFTTALSKKSGDASRAYALNYRGGIYVKIEKDKEALADFEESITYRWDNPLPHYNIADIYLREGNIDKAKERLEILNGLLEEGKLKGEEKAFAVIYINQLKNRLEEAEKKGKDIIQ